MAPDKKDINWPNLLVSIVNKIKMKKQRPSAEKICLSVQKQVPGLRQDMIKNHLKEALLQGKLVKLVKNGQASYDTVSEQSCTYSPKKAATREMSIKSKSQMSKPDLSEIKKKHPTNNSMADFFELDVVWAQMSGYPSWPAMVRSSPENIFKRENKIHVQFFGDLSRAWVSKNRIKMFHPENMKVQNKSKLKKALIDSIEEATEVYKLPRDEREGYLIPMKVDKFEAKLKDKVNLKEEMGKSGQFSQILEKNLNESVNAHLVETKDLSNKKMKNDIMDETDDSISIEDMYKIIPEQESVNKDIDFPTEEVGKAFCNSSLKHFNSLKVNIEKMSMIRHNLESPVSREVLKGNHEPTVLNGDKQHLETKSQTHQFSSGEDESPQTRGHRPSSIGGNSFGELSQTGISQKNQMDSPDSEEESQMLQSRRVNCPYNSEESLEPVGSPSVDDFKRWMETSYIPIEKDISFNNDEKGCYPSNVSPIETSRNNEKRKKNWKQSRKSKQKSNILEPHTSFINQDASVKRKSRFGVASAKDGFSAPGIRRIKSPKCKLTKKLLPNMDEPRRNSSQSSMENSCFDFAVSEIVAKVSNSNDHLSRILPEVIDVGGETDEDRASYASRNANFHEILAANSKSVSSSSTALESVEISNVDQQSGSFLSAMKDLPQNVSEELAKLSESTEGASPKYKVELTVTSKQLIGLKLLGFI